ncbi:hypothetical protein ACVXZ4_10870 [Lacisediminihabitans sp. FW035]
MISSHSRMLAAVSVAGLVVFSFAGCSRIAALSDDFSRIGAAVIRDVSEAHPHASLPRAELKTNLARYLSSQQWADAKAAIAGTQKLSRTDPVCGTTIDTVLDGKPETTESLFLKLAENTAGMNNAYSLNQDAKTLSTYLSSTNPTEEQKAAFAVAVAAFKDAYCK